MTRRISTLQASSMGSAWDVNVNYETIKVLSDNIDSVLFVEANLHNSLKYLGASTSPPTERLDGSAIEDGDYYFNTTDGTESITYYDLTNDLWFAIDPAAVADAVASAVEAKEVAEAAVLTINDGARVIPYTVSGVFVTGGAENQIRDGGTFNLPLASSVPADTVCLVALPDAYSTFSPTIQALGSDLFVNTNTTDAEINITSSTRIRFTSNGSNRWTTDTITGTPGSDGVNIETQVVESFPDNPVTGTLYIKV